MEVTFGRSGRARFEGIAPATLAAMSEPELQAELERVRTALGKLESALAGQPRYARFIPENVKEKNCLYSERRRIQCEIAKRVVHHAALDQAMDACEAREKVKA